MRYITEGRDSLGIEDGGGGERAATSCRDELAAKHGGGELKPSQLSRRTELKTTIQKDPVMTVELVGCQLKRWMGWRGEDEAHERLRTAIYLCADDTDLICAGK